MKLRVTYQDLQELRGRAIAAFANMPVQLELSGQGQLQLSDDDRRALAFLEASLVLAGRLGLLKEVDGPLGDVVRCPSVWSDS